MKKIFLILCLLLIPSVIMAQSVIIYRQPHDPTAEVNWADITELDLTGINWPAYENESINWVSINEEILTGINWDTYLGGEDVNWSAITELDLDGINWASYLNNSINWAVITESDLTGINWTNYENESINWTTINELILNGINWSDYENANINWASLTELDLSGVNWTAHDEYGVLRDDWTTHDDYPDDCPTGYYAVGLGDELTCEEAISYSPWFTSDGVVYLYDTTHDVFVGPVEAGFLRKFGIIGDADQTQLLVRGHSSQTSNLIEAQQSDGTTVFFVDNDGGTAFGDGTVGGSVRMKESASPPGIISAGYGQYWVDSSKLPRFTDGDGINWTLLTEDTVVDSINWTTIDELVLDGINWSDYLGGADDINWSTITETDLDGINWTDYDEDGVNWVSINELVLTGINWSDYENEDINWTTITEAVLDGINWDTYLGGGEEVNWADITELDLTGINWTAYENVAINWTTITEATLNGINWTDYDITHPDEMADADFGDFTCASGDCTLDSAGSADYVFYLRPHQAKLPSTNSGAINPAGTAIYTALFDADAAECLYWPAGFLRPLSGTLKAKLAYKMASATSGTVEFELSTGCVADAGTDDDTIVFGTADNLSATVPGSAGTQDILADAALEGDSCALDSLVYFRLCRDADDGTNDTAEGDAEYIGGVVYAE